MKSPIFALALVAALAMQLALFGCASQPQPNVKYTYVCPDGSQEQDLLLCKQLPARQAACAPNSYLKTNSSSLKVIGMIGGTSWYSSEEYYRIMNERLNERLGDPHSAKILMYSIEFDDVSDEVERGNSQDLAHVGAVIVDAAKRLEEGGAEFIIIGSNTMNVFVPEVSGNVSIPVLHIADATGSAVSKSGIRKVALLGSKIVLEHDYYKDILMQDYNLSVVVPNEAEREYLNKVIFNELVVGNFKKESKDKIVRIIHRLEKEEGAQGVILGCTELPLLIKQKDVNIPVFDTTEIHATAAVDYSLGSYDAPKDDAPPFPIK